ncbi:type III restriction-modification system endonuclease [Bordetella bronchiseptica]|uniref:Type III restriction enzyme n=1 Tax=Bordetella bronchiseptica (strain ATCC BAA-588 / NCTC 13252 / RB50) TaxID=257310 RepID=A0A0H3LRK7_BORBR|nr:DEAD/DEAH box helicase family protein [Bordetella bronchiseptica]KAK66354.1 type III restriction enzyme, res subunit [Bordetella bronchiseptica 980-2]KDD50989.1 type III restriction enzyme, res subunit [Bordetella bronchiseptica OSU553]AMG87409.1 restriction endonuclease subunit R [Bordetella bronchiseptica]KCV46583.1 type III restriction enzyme, res subunit [Bordetella bronchiseptica 3E44]KCV60181.1 type III restriction enzyme, res subunit [Bordetella bronchiseptica 980]
MKLKFKTQAYQTAAVQAVVDCFKGQVPHHGGIRYRLDPGSQKVAPESPQAALALEAASPEAAAEKEAAFRNADFTLSETALLDNIQAVQRGQNLPLSDTLVKTKVAKVNLDIEMETGTGKTYCYIKTIFELNKLYGWSKFIIVVPSVAIREGVAKSLEITAEHFLETYRKKARFFIYNSKQLHHLESFSSDAGINVMVINVQAFASRGAENRRIYDVLDDFQSRRPIDVISANRPIMILDEPQKMEGAATLKSLEAFKALMVLRYSATHKTTHNKIHRLDALDAYNQKLVKKIAVRGIAVKGLAGTAGYLYLQSIEISSKKPPEARIELEHKLANGDIKRVVRKLGKGDNLFDLSGGLDQYRNYVVTDINANTDTLSFTNGVELTVGDATGDVTEAALRRIQIREAIKAHFDKEQALFQQGVKVLTLFFIDEVAKYRDYTQADEKGEYARIFEEEYTQYLNEMLDLDETAYVKYLKGIPVDKTHSGYFSIDKKTKRLADPTVAARGENAGLSDDVDAYDLILKDKERLLSLAEPVRFIFSHSALREGWDNPNVFVICALKHSDNTISRRQEVGRGLRLSVNQTGDRMDHPATVHEVNVLTVVASESYKDFVAALQKDISDSLSERPRVANEEYFTGKVLKTATGDVPVTPQLAKQIYRYLVKNDYTDDSDRIAGAYHDAKKAGTLADLPDELKPHAAQVYQLIDSVFSASQLPDIGDDRKPKKNPLNANFDKQEFKALWNRINRKAAYSVDFDSDELVQKAVKEMDAALRVTPLQYTIQAGEQIDQVTGEALKRGDGFKVAETQTEYNKQSIHSAVKYDLIGKLAEGTQLTRRTVAEILKGINLAVFAQFKTNPESFVAEATRLINEQKATVIIEHLAYDPVEDKFDLDIFTAGQTKQDFSKADDKLQRHIYDYVLTDSKVEREFVKELDTANEVVVYAKLPRGFLIPTPVGDYNPDWAISFKEGAVKHIYFVAETKGSMSSMDLREIEKTKIKCARKFFDEMNRRYAPENVKYDVVDSFGKLMEVVK